MNKYGLYKKLQFDNDKYGNWRIVDSEAMKTLSGHFLFVKSLHATHKYIYIYIFRKSIAQAILGRSMLVVEIIS